MNANQLPYTVGWQDLKDLFRAAGSIIRADVKMAPDGSHTGTGTVIYETPQDAQNAIGAAPSLSGSRAGPAAAESCLQSSKC